MSDLFDFFDDLNLTEKWTIEDSRICTETKKKVSTYPHCARLCKEGSRMEGTLNFDSLDWGANF